MFLRTFLIALLLLTGCVHRKITIEPLQKECSALLAKYVPLFELPGSVDIYANCCCKEGAEASVTDTSLFFGLWKQYRVEIESEDAFYALSPDMREFIICHELAHIKLGHLEWHFIWEKPTFNRAESHQKEYAADALAVEVIGKSRGAITYFANILLWLCIGMCMVLSLIFVPYGIIQSIRRKKWFAKTIRVWIIASLCCAITVDLVVPLFSTHPACIVRLLHVVTQAWY